MNDEMNDHDDDVVSSYFFIITLLYMYDHVIIIAMFYVSLCLRAILKY